MFVRLLAHARESMLEGGQVVLSAEGIEITAANARCHPAASFGRFLCIRVSDTGCGIPPEQLSHVFEPFFSARDQRQASDLGLAMVYGIVKQHKGWIEVESHLGQGTTFTVFLPAGDADGAPAAVPRVPQPLPATILVVEDDVAVREYVATVLSAHGYAVLSAGTAEAATELCAQHEGQIALAVVDMVIPGGPAGDELARQWLERYPWLKVICMSGYFSVADESADPSVQGFTFLPKPCEPAKLVQAVRTALDQGTSAARAGGGAGAPPEP
jgi:two-component system, cell cycle sensor histidine kinase and response regulator CckA